MIRKFLTFNWVLNIRRSDPLIILLLIHPIYVIWIYKIGSNGEKLLGNKRNILFFISNSIVFILIFVFFLQFQFTLIDSKLITCLENNDFHLMSILIGIIGFCWIYSSYYSMKIIIKLEKQRNEEYYSSLTTKIHIFFQLLYWIFGIWVLQQRLNELFDNSKT